jgi:hypothetical protein
MDAMGMMRTVSRLKPQKLYYPRSMIATTRMLPDGTMMTTAAPGRLGAGYDVLQAQRGQPGYSPLCQVMTFDAGATLEASVLPRDVSIIETIYPPATLQPASPPYVYCLQVSP